LIWAVQALPSSEEIDGAEQRWQAYAAAAPKPATTIPAHRHSLPTALAGWTDLQCRQLASNALLQAGHCSALDGKSATKPQLQ